MLWALALVAVVTTVVVGAIILVAAVVAVVGGHGAVGIKAICSVHCIIKTWQWQMLAPLYRWSA